MAHTRVSYYEYLSPLTPISPPTFRNPASHLTLLTEEPILTVTLLTISSRYCQLSGTGGHCRSYAIHEQLWTYLRGMIERCLWGQEAFGGGFVAMAVGASSMEDPQTSSTAPWRGLRKGSLRTLGTIESLMILTEWHPRALHFPPDEAIDELILPAYDGSDAAAATMTDENGNQRLSAGIGGRRIESWLEPAWRSDRMCWMLLSTAMGLAYELGVFDDIDELLRNGAISRPEYEEETYRQRANRIKRLLLIYLTQLAGRLGWTNMVPEALRRSDPAVARKRSGGSGSGGGSSHGGGGGGGGGSGSGGGDGTTPSTNPSSLSNGFNYIPDLELDDQIIHCWAGITNAMHLGNEKLFRSRQHTKDIIQSGKYTEHLQEFRPILDDWHREFLRYRLPPFTRYILSIEYEYVRIYVNSLSLQAVVERSASNAGNTVQAGQGGQVSMTTAQLSPQTQNYFGKLPLGQLGGFGATDQEYIREVVDGCRNLLRTVVEGLLPGDYLKHAPVRTYFRIISGAMFLLKTFALGAPRSDVKLSIDLMDSTVEALRNCVVDDVHLGIRFADLLDSLTSRLRNRFIQAPLLGHSGDARSPDPMQAGAAHGGAGLNGHGAHGDGQNWATHASRLREGLNASGTFLFSFFFFFSFLLFFSPSFSFLSSPPFLFILSKEKSPATHRLVYPNSPGRLPANPTSPGRHRQQHLSHPIRSHCRLFPLPVRCGLRPQPIHARRPRQPFVGRQHHGRDRLGQPQHGDVVPASRSGLLPKHGERRHRHDRRGSQCRRRRPPRVHGHGSAVSRHGQPTVSVRLGSDDRLDLSLLLVFFFLLELSFFRIKNRWLPASASRGAKGSINSWCS